MKDSDYKKLAGFYNNKLREPAGGTMFKVASKGKDLGTFWGRSKKELTAHFNKIRCHFDKMVEI